MFTTYYTPGVSSCNDPVDLSLTAADVFAACPFNHLHNMPCMTGRYGQLPDE